MPRGRRTNHRFQFAGAGGDRRVFGQYRAIHHHQPERGDLPGQEGWYLPTVYNNVLTGERVIYQASLVSGRIVFTTLSVDTVDPCASFGSGKLVELDAFSGKMLNYAVLDTNADGVVDGNDTISSGVIFTGGIPTLNAVVNDATRKIVNDSGGGVTTLVEKSGGGSGRRIMWRQIQ